jgi:CMP-N-acetylneuraminic acid synthetase
MKQYKVLIPARKNSKRLPLKNRKFLADKPLFQYSIEYAMKEGFSASDIIVSSDDEILLDMADKFGVELHQRGEIFSGDYTTSGEVLKNAWQELRLNDSHCVLLQPTNPFRPKKTLLKLLEIMDKQNVESIYTISTLNQKVGKLSKDQTMSPLNYQFGQRSQEMSKFYFENGLIYITSPEMIRNGIVHNESSKTFVVDSPESSVDIDGLNDFLWAEFVFKNILNA